MSYLSNLLSLTTIPVLLAGCEGALLMTKPTCGEGKIQSGSLCVDATTTKASLVGCVDVDLSKVVAGSKLTMCDASTGVGTYVAPTTSSSSSSSSSSTSANCTADGQVGCLTTSTFKSADTSVLSASKIASGTTVAGITGTKPDMKQCRNAANLSMFDISSPAAGTVRIPSSLASVAANTITLNWTHGLTTNDRVQLICVGGAGTQIGGGPVSVGTNYYAIVTSTTNIQLETTIAGGALAIANSTGCTGTWVIGPPSDSAAQNFDTLDDYNGAQATLTSPSSSPWSSDNLCNESNFTNKTGAAPLAPSYTTPTYANQSWTQIWKDELSGLYLTNILHTAAGGSDWYRLSAMCTGLDSLNGGNGGTGWRLPTQKELMMLYIMGISKVSFAGGSTNASFWSSSGVSNLPSSAWMVSLSNGNTSTSTRNGTTNHVLCVR